VDAFPGVAAKNRNSFEIATASFACQAKTAPRPFMLGFWEFSLV